MPKPQQTSLTPVQAQYVLERLLADGRIIAGEIGRYLGDIQREIAGIEARLAQLRDAGGAAVQRVPPERLSRQRPNGSRTRPRRRRRIGNPIAGSYMGYMRQVTDPHKKAEFKKLKEERGFADAIAALKQHLGK
jgi:hypothetical protein